METAEVPSKPVDFPAYHQARSRALGLLSMWLMDEREKCDPKDDRWKALADVSHELRRLEDQERGLKPTT